MSESQDKLMKTERLGKQHLARIVIPTGNFEAAMKQS